MGNKTRMAMLALGLAMGIGTANAQTAKLEYNENDMFQFIPKSLSSDGNVRLVTKSSEGSDGTKKINITVYDSNFEQEKVISNNVRVASAGNKKTRNATSATVTEADSIDITYDIEYSISSDNIDGNITADEFMTYINNMGYTATADGYYYIPYESNGYYGEWIFGQRYPYHFIIFKDGKGWEIHVMKYTPDFTNAEWTSSSWTDYEYDMVRTFRLLDLDEDKNYSQSRSMILTQGLFNDDDKYEYIRTMRKAGGTGDDESSYVNVEGYPSQTVYIDDVTYGICGYEVVNEDGDVVFTINVDDEDIEYYTEDDEAIEILKMNGEVYFVISTEYYTVDNSKLLIYKLDKSSNSVKKITTANDILISPKFVGQRQPVSIDFSQPTSTPASVVVTSLDGKMVGRYNVKAGETSVKISTTAMASGLYNFTVYGKGGVLENGKVVVK